MLTPRRSLVLAGGTVCAALAVAAALPAHVKPATGAIDPYAPSYAATTAEVPARWAVRDYGVKWSTGARDPFVVCVLVVGDGRRETRTVPVPLTTWLQASPVAWTPGANCPG